MFRKFGQKKRFSEKDKQELTRLIGVKLQLVHNDWGREKDKTGRELDRVRAEIEAKDNRGLRLASVLREFVLKHQGQLARHNPGGVTITTITTAELFHRMIQVPKRENVFEDFKENLESFFRQVEMTLRHRDALLEERERCLMILKVKVEVDGGRVQLDQVVGRVTGMSLRPDGGRERKEEVLERLKGRVEELEKQLVEYDEEMATQRKQMAERERVIANLRHRIHIE